ncbi:hypothetical protein [Nostoc sp.]|uniref:hypothetical protein n=1 Tax=Nostoc sp. TaxID=1180 RepID=UPI002FFD53E0
MNTNQDDTTSSINSLQLSELDPASITALSDNLANTPIIPEFLKESVNVVLSFLRKNILNLVINQRQNNN